MSHRSSCRPSDCMHTHYDFLLLCLESHRKLPSGVSTCAHVAGIPLSLPACTASFWALLGSPLLWSLVSRLRALPSNEQSSLLIAPQGLFVGLSSAVQGSSLLPAPLCIDFRVWLNQKMRDSTDQRGFVVPPAHPALALNLACQRLTWGN